MLETELLVLTFFCSISSLVSGATAVIDAFSESPFVIGSGAPTNQHIGLVSSPVVTTRKAEGFTSGVVPSDPWTATVDAPKGTLVFTTGSNSADNLRLDYTNTSGAFMLTEFIGVSVDFTDVVGSGWFSVLIDGGGVRLRKVEVNEAGSFDFLFSRLIPSNDLTSVDTLSVVFFSNTSDFEAEVNQISLIPEPNSGLLGLIGLFLVVRRRRILPCQDLVR